MNGRLVIFAVITLVLVLAALMLLRRSPRTAARVSAPPPAATLPTVDRGPTLEPRLDPGAGLAEAGKRALAVNDAAAAVRLFEQAVAASPGNGEWRRQLEEARAELAARTSRPQRGAPIIPERATPSGP